MMRIELGLIWDFVGLSWVWPAGSILGRLAVQDIVLEEALVVHDYQYGRRAVNVGLPARYHRIRERPACAS